MTLAFQLVESKDGTNVLNVGKAICSPKDNFSRPRGREIASARLDAVNKGSIVPDWNSVPLAGVVRTKHTLNEDIHNTLSNWAYGC
jgi:hypothetical protein